MSLKKEDLEDEGDLELEGLVILNNCATLGNRIALEL